MQNKYIKGARISERKFRKVLETTTSRALAFLLAALACLAPLRAAERKPNFLFLYTDDQRWDALGVVQREHGEKARYPWFKTPGIRPARGRSPRATPW